MDMKPQRVDSFAELREMLRVNARSVLLGQNDEAHKEYWVFRLGDCLIGICSQGHGVQPSCRIDDRSDGAWVGFNSGVAYVHLETCRCEGEYELDCVFHDFVAIMSDGSAVVVYELGACRIDPDGEFLWNQHTDVVISYRDTGSEVLLMTDGGEIHIDKESGSTLPAGFDL
jgi:hypothetical protein